MVFLSFVGGVGGLAFSVAGFACRCSNCLPPSPLPPFPAGRGSFSLSYARGFAPCIPGAEPGRHWLSLRGRCPAGGWLFRFPDLPAVAVPFCPHPPSPRSQSALPLRGRGEIFSFLMQGASPLASPGAEPGRRGLNLRWRCPAGACPSGRRLGQMFRYRASYRIFQSRQKRLSRFCNTQNHSHHVCCKTSPGPGTNAGSNQEYIGKVLGGLGASFKKPPTFPRFPCFPVFPVSPFPRFPVSRLYLFSLPMR